MIFLNLFVLIIIHAVIISASVSKSDLLKYAKANNNLAARLYPRLIEGSSSNIFFCPSSIMTGLGMVLYGARGNTQKELYSVLGYEEAGLPNEKVPPTFHYMFTEQIPEDNPNIVNYTLECGDEVLVTNKAPLDSTYVNNEKNQYVTDVKNADFENNPEGVVRDINNFVSQQTSGKIKSLVNSVSPSTSALVIDTTFFRGNWMIPFPSQLTAPQPFYSSSGSKNVPFMHLIEKFPYTATDEYQATFLPYVGGNIGVLIFLPNERNGLANLEKSMTPDQIIKVLHKLKSTNVYVCIPKFNTQYNHNFTNDMRELGANSAYDGSGDFSGMTDESNNLVVTGPLYKAYLEVYEGDTSVPSSSAPLNFNIQPPPKYFTADHPHMFAIVDKREDLILFIGRIVHLD